MGQITRTFDQLLHAVPAPEVNQTRQLHANAQLNRQLVLRALPGEH